MIEKAEKIIIVLTGHVAFRFFISGSTSAIVDLGLLYLSNSVFGIHYIPSAIGAFIGAFGVSFTLHKYWTFRSHGESTHKQAILYLGTSLVGLLLNTALMYLFVDIIFSGVLLHHMDIKVLLSQVIVGLIVAVFSFFLSHHFVFKYKKGGNLEVDIT